MSRKITIVVTTLTMVPIITKITATVNADEGVSMDMVAKAVAHGRIIESLTVEDSTSEVVSVEGADATQVDQSEIEQQISDFIEGDDRTASTIIGHEVQDSR